MNRRKYLVGLAGGALLLAGTSFTALAAVPGPAATPAAGNGSISCPVTGQPMGAGMMGQGGMMDGRGWGGAFSALDPVAKLLGIDQATLATERQSGKSLVQIAQARGVTEDKLVAAILADRKATLDARVNAGTLTAEQAKLMLDRMQDQVKESVERTTVGRPEDAGRGMGPGMMGGGRGMRGQGSGPGMGGYGRGASQ